MSGSEKRISIELQAIEDEFDVTIIYACESGSRAWGFPSKDSDFDVRMIYFHPIEWYLSLGKHSDVIEKPIVGTLDISGWDIAKTLVLLRKSNPNILEWAQSPVVYKETPQFKLVRSVLPNGFNPRSSLLHYLSMADNNRRVFLQGPEVNLKKYLYTIRPLLCAVWVDRFKSQPPMLYNELMETVISDSVIKAEIYSLVERKQNMDESDMIPRNEMLYDWIGQTREKLEARVPGRTKLPNLEPFNRVFHRIIDYKGMN